MEHRLVRRTRRPPAFTAVGYAAGTLDTERRDPATLTRTVGIHVYHPDSGVPADPDDEAV